MIIRIIFCAFIIVTSSGYPRDFADEVYKWKRVEYENLPKSEHSWIGPYEYYIPENVDISGFAFHPASGLMLVVMVRLRPGVPTSLGAFCVNEYGFGSSPKIWGFPNYQLNTLLASDFAGGIEEDEGRKAHKKHNKRPIYHNYNYYNGYYHGNVYQKPFYETPSEPPTQEPEELNRIISVFHINLDERCNRAFFVDHGQLQYYMNSTYTVHNPTLWIVDLPSNGCESRQFSVIRQREIPDKIAAQGHYGFMHVVPDYQSESCDDVFLYITNAFSGFLTVYDYKRDEFWSFDHQTFKPVIAESHLAFRKTFNYDMPLGLFSIALGYPDKNGDQTAYYTSVAGTAQYAVSTKILKDRRKSPANFNPDDFRIMGYLGCDHQPLKNIIDYTYGVMFYADVQNNEIRCWNINKPLNPDNIDVVFKSNKYFFGPQMITDSRGYLWFQSTHIPVLFTSDLPLDLNKVNSRIFRIKVSDAIRGTLCEDEY